MRVEQLSLAIFAIVVHVWCRIIAQMLLNNLQLSNYELPCDMYHVPAISTT
jgi:hypothetical protein